MAKTVMPKTVMPKRKTITIDGRELEYEPGQTVIQVAKANGIEIPHYCYHPGLSVAGNCRICMVEVEGWDRPQISCKLQPNEGMVVNTQSELAQKATAGPKEMLKALSDSPQLADIAEEVESVLRAAMEEAVQ